jgi:hypothetical protein
MNYISIQDFKAQYPSVDVTLFSDVTLSGFVTQASADIDGFLGYTLLREDVANEKCSGMVDSDNNLIIYTTKRPIHSVSSVQIVKGTYSGTVALTSSGKATYDIPSTEDRIVFPGADITLETVSIIDWAALRTTNFWTLVSYNAGYYGYEIPQPIQRACALLTMDILARKQNIAGASEIRQGGISMKFSEKTGESDLVKDAHALLAPYQVIAMI